jgi:hypothetical protein
MRDGMCIVELLCWLEMFWQRVRAHCRKMLPRPYTGQDHQAAQSRGGGRGWHLHLHLGKEGEVFPTQATSPTPLVSMPQSMGRDLIVLDLCVTWLLQQVDSWSRHEVDKLADRGRLHPRQMENFGAVL